MQHNALVSRVDQLEAEAGEVVRILARLWQLQNKMQSVGSSASYGERSRNPPAQWLCLIAPC